jgi:hypothetical protein
MGTGEVMSNAQPSWSDNAKCAKCGKAIAFDGTYWYHTDRALEAGSDICEEEA